jgi:23S rRNA U2552 (ribose-2'-O)-methylase RlmE/FtsJ
MTKINKQTKALEVTLGTAALHLEADVDDPQTLTHIRQALKERNRQHADVVLSDMAPKATGVDCIPKSTSISLSSPLFSSQGLVVQGIATQITYS